MPSRLALSRAPSEIFTRLRAEIYADFEQAAQSLYYIEMRDGGGLQLTHLWHDQLLLTRSLQRQRAEGRPARAVVLKTRRAGISTIAAEWTFHNTYWRDHQHALVLTNHQDTTDALYNIYQTLYAELPKELQAPLERNNARRIETVAPYSSSITALTAGFQDVGRGPTLHHAHLSEVDYYLDPSRALDGVLNAVHLGPHTTVIIESTANGADNWLHRFWRATKAGKTGFVAIFSPWFNVPEHRLPVPADFEPTDEERERMRQYGLGLEQMAWYRYKLMETIAKEPWGGDRKMRQEHPYDDEEAFQTSGHCIFPDVVLKRLHEGCRPPLRASRLEMMPEPGQVREVDDDPDPGRPQLWIWKTPEEGRWYSLGVDISDGVGETESVVSVVAYPGYEQVAEWASDQSSVEETSYVTRFLAQKYGGDRALVIPETNRNGSLILHILFQLPGDYSIFRWRYLDRPGVATSEQSRLGWQTNDVTKRALAQVSNLVFLRGEGSIASEVLYQEMKICIDIGMRWRGKGGRSDRVVAYLIAMIGIYLEYEGGYVGNIASDRERAIDAEVMIRDPATYDAGWEKILSAPVAVTSMLDREDME